MTLGPSFAGHLKAVIRSVQLATLYPRLHPKSPLSTRFFSIVNGTYSSYNCYPHQTTQGNNVFVSHLERIGVASFFTAGLIGRPKQAGGDSLQVFPAGMPAGKTC
jgi:hypothetical protein